MTIERVTHELLRHLHWEGIALVEYKMREDGTFVLMEINPKFWASYPLASRSGYRFACEVVVTNSPAIERNASPRRKRDDLEMVFPIRELYYLLTDKGNESTLEVLRAILKQHANWDVDWTDPMPWIAPAGLVGTVQLASKLITKPIRPNPISS